jgi:hypothetical protein
MNRMFRAVDVKTGKTLWETRLGTSVQGFPLTFSIGGRQYIAVTTGLGGGSPRIVPAVLAGVLPSHTPVVNPERVCSPIPFGAARNQRHLGRTAAGRGGWNQWLGSRASPGSEVASSLSGRAPTA